MVNMNRRIKGKGLALVAVLILAAFSLLFAYNANQQTFAKAFTSMAQVTRSMSNIGNWGYWVYYDGKSGQTPNGSSGGIYPRGTAGAIYQDGFVWGTMWEDGSPRVGGVTYNIGTQAGWLTAAGTPVSTSDPAVRIYRIRPDWRTLTHAQVLADAAELNMVSTSAVTEAMTQEIIDQYEQDWMEWPVEHGAPWVDVDGDGEYDPEVDEAGIANADQVLFFVTNDQNASRTTGLYGSQPIGLEVRTTIWAYAQPAARLGQLIFKKYNIINKSGKDLDEFYVAQWADPDLGTYTNDFVGCDTTLGIGYAYNGTDSDDDYAAFGLAPAAFGYDFFQGPLVPAPGETGHIGFQPVPDHKNLMMTSFGWFSAGSPITDPTLQEYEGTIQWYNMMRGFQPLDDLNNPTPWTIGNVDGGTPTRFPMSGDPVAGTGDLDGEEGGYFEPGDRRMALISGPFTFNAGDEQEIVVAVIGGISDTRLNSVVELKKNSQVAQTLFDGAFTGVPKAPKGPQVNVRPLEDKVVLEWGSSGVADTENPIIAGYEFQGYCVYQLPSSSASLADGVLIATYDKVDGVTTIMQPEFVPEYGMDLEIPVKHGMDTGIKRYFFVEKDYLTNGRLLEGKTYYFAVTAYNYNANPDIISAKSLESAGIALQVTIQEPLPGTRLANEAGETIEIKHSGPSDGQALATVVDPFNTKNKTYQMFFVEDTDTNSATYGELLWSVKDSATQAVLPPQNNRQVSDLSAATDAPIYDGVQVAVSGPPLGIKSIYETDAADAVVDGSVSYLPPSLGTTGYLLENRIGTANGDLYAMGFDRFHYWGMDDLEINFGEESMTWDYITEAVHRDDNGNPTKAPFAIYRHKFDTGERIRLFAGYWDTDENGEYSVHMQDDGSPYWEGAAYHAPSYEPIYAWQGYDASGNEISYDPANEAQYAADDALYTSANITWGVSTGEFVYPYVNNTLFTMYLGSATLPIGNKVWFKTNKANTAADIFSFKMTAATTGDETAALEDIEKVNVFPNPYYARNQLSSNPYDNYVTFTHLPAKAEIRIFNLAGVQVRVINHDNPNSQFAQWDLTNASDIPVASGLYLAHIEFPDLNKSKVLKLFVVQKEQILQYY
jgi:hypothetical protein